MAKMRRESIDEFVQTVIDLAVFNDVVEVWGSQRRMGREIFLAGALWVRFGLSYFLPDVVGYGWPSVGGKSGAAVGVEAAKGMPEADTASLK
ncbi:MAG: hypothetical protein Q7O66_18860 [Dehalococcoidia bacterium]|nr:hypothetical protein [Dehalococcoidia bacterium]